MSVLFRAGLEPPAPEIAWLWPCNVNAWFHWNEVQTQWRVGMGGATGLDYAGVRAYLDEAGVAGSERTDTFKGIQAAERAVLEVWADQARERQEQQDQKH